MENTKNMKVGYFSHTKVKISETFIYDLIKALDKENEDFTFYTGAETTNSSLTKNQFATGFSTLNEKRLFLNYKLGQLAGNKGDKYKMDFKKKHAFTALQNTIKSNFL